MVPPPNSQAPDFGGLLMPVTISLGLLLTGYHLLTKPKLFGHSLTDENEKITVSNLGKVIELEKHGQ